MGVKLEVGKWYKTRDGRKAYVGFMIPRTKKGEEPFWGFIVGEMCDIATSWYDDGRFLWMGAYNDSDLIREWHEPRSITVDVYFVEVDGQEHSYTLKSGVPARLGAKILGKRLGITINEGDGMEEKQCSAN